MVVQLAIFEKEPEAVIATLENYYKAFEDGIIAGHFAVAENGKTVGMTLYYEGFSTWKGKMLYLDDFVVWESYRRYGVGQLLYDAFLEEGRKRGCRLVKWQVLDWNTPALRFYEKNDAIVEKDWWNCKVFLRH